MILNIIFSYNRAMQLDYLLKSVLKRFKVESKIVIIYHTTNEHKRGYDLLQQKYISAKNIEFRERKKLFFDISYLFTLYDKKNWRFFYEKNFFKKNGDNFKHLVQETIKNSGCEFVMFNTDDGLFFNDVTVPEEVLNIIKNNPEDASYRMYIGDNLEGFPAFVQSKEEYYQWDYYTEKKIHHWTFPFSVDGTIYNSNGLLKHLKKIAYNNPVSLERNGEIFMRHNKLFKIGLSPIKSNLVQTKLNRVSVDTLNPTIHINPDFLNKKFLEGFSLELVLNSNIDNANLVPDKIILVKGEIRELIYTLDEEGQKIQSLLGIEGALVQLK